MSRLIGGGDEILKPTLPPGGRKLSQLEENLASLDVKLSEEQLKSLNEASRIDFGSPYAWIFSISRGTINLGRLPGRAEIDRFGFLIDQVCQ